MFHQARVQRGDDVPLFLPPLPPLRQNSYIMFPQVMLAGESLGTGVSTERIADLTDGCSGSDLRQICTAAAMRPVRELLRASGKSASIASKVGSCFCF